MRPSSLAFRVSLVGSSVGALLTASTGVAGDKPDKQLVGAAVQPGRFWGEAPGPSRSLVPKGSRALFRWEGTVEGYAVLEVTDAGVVASDCGQGGVKTGRIQWNGESSGLREGWLVLTTCDGPGRVRVIQSMNVAEGATPRVELDDRDVPGASSYVIEGSVVSRADVDRTHSAPADAADRWAAALQSESTGDLDAAAGHWSWVATHTADEAARLWAIERLCMARRYPGPAPSPVEQVTLTGYASNEPIETLAGSNAVLAWPKEYAGNTPTKWRHLAELDAALDWLAVWTAKDQVAARGKRLIVRFRTDDGGTALYVDFRLHIPRKEMKFPPDHGPCSHEASHGFIDFPSICPTGRYAEGLTEVSRTSFWWFLGIEDAWRPFRANCMDAIEANRGKTLDKVPSYGAAAGVYFSVEEAVRPKSGGSPDWASFAKLFEAARGVAVPKDMSVPARFGVFADVCEKSLGKKARSVLMNLGMPE